MSHSHEDRVADRQAGMCAAYGCPLHGTMSNNTTGGDDWWCFLHHGREGAMVQQITTAIHRHRWLADVLTTALEIHPARDGNEGRMEWIRKTLKTANRDDLQWAGHPENIRQWTNRLKPALEQLVMADVQVPAQTEIAGTKATKDTWQKASALIPAW